METPEQQLIQYLNDQGPDGGLTFLMGELYERVGEAKTTLQWLLHTTTVSPDVQQCLEGTVPVLQQAREHMLLLDVVRAHLTKPPT